MWCREPVPRQQSLLSSLTLLQNRSSIVMSLYFTCRMFCHWRHWLEALSRWASASKRGLRLLALGVQLRGNDRGMLAVVMVLAGEAGAGEVTELAADQIRPSPALLLT